MEQTVVDSNEEKLNSFDILTIAMGNMGSKYPPEVALPAVMTELAQPNQQSIQIGNTLFSTLVGDGRKAFFKAYNADTARNFVENSKQYCMYAYNDLGLDVLVTEFEDPTIETLFKAISRNPPQEQMGYVPIKMKSGRTRIVLQLGPQRG